ncbi:lipid-A-disaccharide synthase N-terminal domain-containing protein [soil metagenome]
MEGGMHEVIFEFLGASVTPWKLVGYTGVFLFSARWFVQMWASKRMRRVEIPRLFWYMSIVGSALCLLYFVWGKNDSVGILAYAFPTVVSIYNLALDIRSKREAAATLPGG